MNTMHRLKDRIRPFVFPLIVLTIVAGVVFSKASASSEMQVPLTPLLEESS